ncbi:hypothetical protein EJ03DRAFT_346377 [Teratosphaeria nubilosa]|uniref:Uncharacterized protein n=1 Tax=Teratosphaeria nubilosa TaxID=161662 RepID=A0A6G1KV49_9PEZI|nr:hypothetical protein EJ03DRAFT_346377 [Teratosphaeria nubilosa]
MTVETETVASIPQSALNPGDRIGSGRVDPSGTLRLKPSTETIRPKKERKKPSQKARSINQGTASSKADIFEARVANTMDEANTSDSDETFVYESNPPEQARRPRHHSRTPSVASSHSLADQRPGGVRGLESMMDERRVAGKRSMKFSNTAYNEDSPDSKNGTIRSAHARHYGKLGRGGSQGGIYDPESPFTQASKLRNTHSSLRHSRPNSPRSPQNVQPNRPSGLFARKEQSFDLGGEGADDERTPLVGTVRTPRTPRHARRLHTADGSVRSIDEFYSARDRACCTRFSGCLLGFLVVVLVVMSAVGFLVMSNRPMSDVKIKKIQNVLASEQELMLDLLVGATNPNALGITITEMDVNIFAKSKHAGSGVNPDITSSRSLLMRRRGQMLQRKTTPAARDEDPNLSQDLSAHWRAPSTSGDNRDDGTDPPEDGDLDSDAHTMLLGRIFHFDQALTFEGSPLKRHEHYGVGELRLMHPGNKTETGGTARWERILQHPFELIVRGVLKYSMPVSCRPVSVGVGASVEVHPEDGVDDMGRMRITPIKHDEHWQWIEWDAIKDTLNREEEAGG